jgi:hypothetical protein
MYTVWHADKYKITFKLVIDHWSQGPVPGRDPAVEKHWSSEFCRHNSLCCFSTIVYCCKHLFRYRLSPETFGYTLVYGEGYKLCRFSLHNFPHLVTSSFLGPNIPLSIQFPNILNLCSFLSVRNQILYPYKTKVTLIFYILIISFPWYLNR